MRKSTILIAMMSLVGALFLLFTCAPRHPTLPNIEASLEVTNTTEIRTLPTRNPCYHTFTTALEHLMYEQYGDADTVIQLATGCINDEDLLKLKWGLMEDNYEMLKDLLRKY